MFELRGQRYEVVFARPMRRNGELLPEGTVVHPRDVIADSYATYVVLAVTRGPEYNGTALIFCHILKDPVARRVGNRTDFYDHTLGLTVRRTEQKVGGNER